MVEKLVLIPIQPSGLSAEWPNLMPGVIKMLDYAGSETPLSRVYNDILTGQCVLWKGTIGGEYVGFVTTRIEKIPFEAWQNPALPHVTNMIIAQLYIKPGAYSVFTQGMEQIESHAKKLGCNEIRFYTMRDKAFEKRMSPYGWKPSYTEFIKPLVSNKEQ